MGQENREMFSIIGVKNDSIALLFNLANQKPAKQTLKAICSDYEKLIFIDHDMEYSKFCSLKELNKILYNEK